MDIAIITCLRPTLSGGNQYVHTTLHDLVHSWPLLPPIRLYPGTPSDDYLAPCLDHAELRPISFGLWERIKLMPTRRRAAANFMRALSDSSGELVIFEDDVRIKSNWFETCVAIVRAYRYGDGLLRPPLAPVRDDRIPFIAMYSAIDYSAATRERFGCHVHANVGHWYELPKPITHHGNSLGLYVPRAHREALAEMVNDGLDKPDGLPFDAIVDRYINETGAEMVVTVPSYVDHVGEISAIAENAFHGLRRAPMF